MKESLSPRDKKAVEEKQPADRDHRSTRVRSSARSSIFGGEGKNFPGHWGTMEKGLGTFATSGEAPIPEGDK